MPQDDTRPLVISLTRACLGRGVITIPFQRRTEFTIGPFTATDANGQALELTVHEDASLSGLRPLFTNQDLQPNDELVLTRSADGMYTLMLEKKPRYARKSPPPALVTPRAKPKERVAPQPQRMSVVDLLSQQPLEHGIPQGRVSFPRDEPPIPTTALKVTPGTELPSITYMRAPAQAMPVTPRHEARERHVLPPDGEEEVSEDEFTPEPAWHQAFTSFMARVREFLNPDQVHSGPDDVAAKETGKPK